MNVLANQGPVRTSKQRFLQNQPPMEYLKYNWNLGRRSEAVRRNALEVANRGRHPTPLRKIRTHRRVHYTQVKYFSIFPIHFFHQRKSILEMAFGGISHPTINNPDPGDFCKLFGIPVPLIFEPGDPENPKSPDNFFLQI